MLSSCKSVVVVSSQGLLVFRISKHAAGNEYLCDSAGHGLDKVIVHRRHVVKLLHTVSPIVNLAQCLWSLLHYGLVQSMCLQRDLGVVEASHTCRLVDLSVSTLRAVEGETLDEYLVLTGEAGL